MSEKIAIHDLVTYHYVENLQYSPDGKTLAWQVAYADEKKNTYKVMCGCSGMASRCS